MAAERYRLSSTQQSFLFQTVRNPHAGLGILQLVLTFEEQFDSNAFQNALQLVVDRHDSLRKSFPLNDAKPWQSIHGKATISHTVHDWRQFPDLLQQQNYQAFLQSDRYRRFDLETPPLLRYTCLLYSKCHSKVVLTFHHLIVDRQSLHILLKEIAGAYDALRMGQPAEFLPGHSDRGFLDFLASDQPTENRDYWTKLLDGSTPTAHLASLRRTQEDPTPAQEQVERTLSGRELLQLKAAAHRLGVSVAMLVYGAWALALHRFSQSEDLIFLATRRGRNVPVPGIDHVVGCLINTVPVRARISRQSPASKWLQELACQWKVTASYEQTSLRDIQSWQHWESGGSAWDSNFLYQHDEIAAAFARTAQASGSRRAVLLQYSDYPLTVAVSRSRVLCVEMKYRASSFRAGTIDSLLDTCCAILSDLANQQNADLGNVRYLSVAQQDRLAASASVPISLDAPEQLLHEAFERHASIDPTRVALYDDAGNLTYGELDRSSLQLARYLIEEGLQPEEPVGILMTRSRDLLISLIATLKAGGCYLPLEPAHPDEVLQRLMKNAGAKRIVTDEAHCDQARALAPLGCSIQLVSERNDRYAQKPNSCSPAHLAYLIPTSGTTGEPKIVEVEHRAATNTIQHSIQNIYAAGDLALVPWLDSPAFDAGIHQIFAPLSAGGALALVEGIATIAASPWWNRLTTFGATPSVLMALLSAGSIPPQAKAVMFGGESFPPKLPGLLARNSAVRKAVNVYGPAEAAIFCTAVDTMAPLQSNNSESGRNIGKPISNASVCLLDQSLQPVPPGTAGEICIGGTGLARGYRANPHLTQRQFVQTSVLEGKTCRMYRTGDVGVLLPDGSFEFHGRLDRQVKVAGVRIELEAVEEALEKVSGINRAVAFVGERYGVPAVCACVQTDADVCLSTVRNWAKKILPMGMAPKLISQVRAMPLTPNGKPDLLMIQTLSAQSSETPLPATSRDSSQAAVWKAWEELLGHDDFGMDDDFFDVGGDSLLALHLVLKLGIEVPPECRWTVNRMAAAMKAPKNAPKLVQTGSREPSNRFWVMPVHLDIARLDAFPGASIWAMSAQMEAIRNPEDHISALASIYKQEVRNVRPHGPYIVGGFCFGGYVCLRTCNPAGAGGRGSRARFVGSSRPVCPFPHLEFAGLSMAQPEQPTEICLSRSKSEQPEITLRPSFQKQMANSRNTRSRCGSLAGLSTKSNF